MNVATWILSSAQLALGITFGSAMGLKLRHPRQFTSLVSRYEIVPRRLSRWAACAIVSGESFVALSMLTGLGEIAGAGMTLVLTGAFTVAVGVNLRRGREIACGCFGAETEPISRKSIRRLGLLALLGVGVLTAHARGIRVVTIVQWGGWSAADVEDAATLIVSLSAVGIITLFVANLRYAAALFRRKSWPESGTR